MGFFVLVQQDTSTSRCVGSEYDKMKQACLGMGSLQPQFFVQSAGADLGRWHRTVLPAKLAPLEAARFFNAAEVAGGISLM